MQQNLNTYGKIKPIRPIKARLIELVGKFLLFGASFLLFSSFSSYAQTSNYAAPNFSYNNTQVDKIDNSIANNETTDLNKKFGLGSEQASKIDGQVSVLDKSSNSGSGGNSQFLEPDEAFKASTRTQNGALIFRVEPNSKYYLYKDKISVLQISPDTEYKKQFEALPVGEMKNDLTFGRVEIFKIPVEVKLKLDKLHLQSDVFLSFNYQGCHEDGLCYAPIVKFYSYKNNILTQIDEPKFNKDKTNLTSISELGDNKLKSGNSNSNSAVGEDNFFANKNLFFIFASFLLAGMALSLTPCVLPMAPILFTIITRFSSAHSKTTSFTISLSYVLGMTFTYTLIGILAAFTGSLLSNAFQNVWVVAVIGLLFVILALGMLGMYKIEMPTSIQNKLLNVSNRASSRDKISGIFLMGAISALVLGPCVAAPMAGALLYIGQTKDVLTGAIALFALSLGMGVPLLVLGLSAGKMLLKAGHWMEYITRIFGLILLGFAIFIITPIVPPLISMIMWGALSIFFGLYLYSLKIKHLPLTAIFIKMISVVALIYGAIILVGAGSGSKNPVKPLQALIEKNYVSARNVDWQKATTIEQLDRELAKAKNQGKIAMVDFYALWCASCIEMDNYTFSDNLVVSSMDKIHAIKLDITKNDSQAKELLKRYGLYGPPAIIFYDSKGVEISSRVIGYQKPSVFLNTLEKIKN